MLYDDLVKKEEGVKQVENIAVGREHTWWLTWRLVVSHLGNNAVSVSGRAPTLCIGGDINGTGMGGNTVTTIIGGEFSGDDVGEGIHLRVFCVVM